MKDRFDEMAKQALGGAGCTCHEAYVGRNLTDPQCVWHDNAEDVAAALRRTWNEAIDRTVAVFSLASQEFYRAEVNALKAKEKP